MSSFFHRCPTYRATPQISSKCSTLQMYATLNPSALRFPSPKPSPLRAQPRPQPAEKRQMQRLQPHQQQSMQGLCCQPAHLRPNHYFTSTTLGTWHAPCSNQACVGACTSQCTTSNKCHPARCQLTRCNTFLAPHKFPTAALSGCGSYTQPHMRDQTRNTRERCRGVCGAQTCMYGNCHNAVRCLSGGRRHHCRWRPRCYAAVREVHNCSLISAQ